MEPKEFTFKRPGEEMFGSTDFQFKPAEKEAALIFEAAPSDNSQVVTMADQQLRSAGMALALAWVEGGDFSSTALTDGAFVMADADESGDVDDDENDHLYDILQAAADAFVSMGADAANVSLFIDNEDDDAGATLGAFLTEKMADVTMEDEEIITQFALGGDLILESMVKAVRGGKVILKRKKRLGFHAKLSSAQRAGLKKARMHAFTGAAKVARRKSMRIRKKMGL